VTKSPWRVRLGAEAEKDFVRILKYTADAFGERQAAIYQTTLIDALTALHSGPDVSASASRDEILPGLPSLHVARQGRRGRHFIMYRALGGEAIEVVRILHDAMDLGLVQEQLNRAG
jgi:toxin ParE1/3/4